MSRMTRTTAAFALCAAALLATACDSELDRTLTYGAVVTDDVTFLPSQPVGVVWADEDLATAEPGAVQAALDEAFAAGHDDTDPAADVPTGETAPATPAGDSDPTVVPPAGDVAPWEPAASDAVPVFAESCRLGTEETLQVASNAVADDTFFFAPDSSPTALMEIAVADPQGIQVAADVQLLPVDGGASWRRARGAVVWTEAGVERTGDVVDGTLCFDSALAQDGHPRPHRAHGRRRCALHGRLGRHPRGAHRWSRRHRRRRRDRHRPAVEPPAPGRPERYRQHARSSQRPLSSAITDSRSASPSSTHSALGGATAARVGAAAGVPDPMPAGRGGSTAGAGALSGTSGSSAGSSAGWWTRGSSSTHRR